METEKLTIDYSEAEIKAISKKLSQIMFERQEESVLHNSFEWSEQIYEFIRSGNKEAIKKSLAESKDWIPGILGNDSLRSMKNCCICFIANLTYRIIHNHQISSEKAYSLSDACIWLIEQAKTKKDAITAAMSGVYEYVDLLRQTEVKQYHHLIKATKDYIFKNLHTKIMISQIASQLEVNVSYLSRVFHQNEGITIQQYILSEKLQQAKNLLRFSEYSVEEISNYLGFASQSHLGKNLKAQTGLTPIQYRQKYSDSYRNHM